LCFLRHATKTNYKFFMKKIIIISLIICAILLLFFIYFEPINNFTNIIPQSNELTTEEINQISKSIVAVRCSTYQTEDGKGDPIFGSGSYLTIQEPKNNSNINILLTNSHVAENPHIQNLKNDYGLCIASFNQLHDYYFYNFADTTISDHNIDLSILTNIGIEEYRKDLKERIENNEITISEAKIEANYYMQTNKEKITNKEVPLNQNNKPMPFCVNTNVGTKIYVFGYPGSADDYILSGSGVGRLSGAIISEEDIDEYNKSRNLIVTEGIISGKGANGYFTTAKIDTGNSGGLAIAKENGRVCIVGIPTWVSVGELDSLGIIQPIENINNTKINWEKLLEKVDF